MDRAVAELVASAAVIAAGPKSYPKAGGNLGGLRVGTRVDNQSSIDGELVEYTVVPGIRKVPLSDFDVTDPYKLYYAKNDIDRVKELAEEIKANSRIDPLIVVLDAEGPYVLEGGHRLGALHVLKAKHLPALIVHDDEAFDSATAVTLTNKPPQTFDPKKVKKIAKQLHRGDPDWEYRVKHDPKGTGQSLIEIYDEEGEFVGHY